MNPIRAMLVLSLGTAAFAQVTLTQVVDGAAYTADIAQGSVFVVKGSGMSAAGYVAATAPTYPSILNNVRITYTAVTGGTVVNALMVYTYNIDGVNQLAAVLPSSTTVGAYDVRVINGATTSAPTRVNVVARKPGIVTASGDGSGIGQSTLAGGLILQRLADVGKIGNFDSRPARPGERVDLWGTGLGPDSASDAGGTSGDQTGAASVRVVVDGQEVTPLYAGRSQGYPGLDQIVFNLPSNIVTGCFIPVQVRAGGVLSNRFTISIASSSICSDAGLSDDTARKYSLGTPVNIAKFVVNSVFLEVPGSTSLTGYSESIYGGFATFSPQQFLNARLSSNVGNCAVFTNRGGVGNLPVGSMPSNFDAGASLNGVRPDNTTFSLGKVNDTNVYVFPGANAATRALPPGTYRLSGTGSPDVGGFSAQTTIPQLTWTNKSSITSINRNTPLTITWSGGGSGLVTVLLATGRTVAGTALAALLDSTVASCVARASAGTLTIPAAVLQQIPVAGFDLPSLITANYSVGYLGVLATADVQTGTFTAPLVRGGNIDAANFRYTWGEAKLLGVQ